LRTKRYLPVGVKPVPEISNDNDGAHGPTLIPVVNGQAEAAILLVESLIHGLIERSIISVSDAVDITQTAIDAKVGIASDAGDNPTRICGTLTILGAMSASLQHDLIQ
jgi:hypothetical protein